VTIGRGGRIVLWVFGALVLAFVYVPLAIVAINSFNSDRTFGWPPPSFTTQWWDLALHAQGPRDALWTSVKAGLGATAIALVLGSLLGMALTRFDFFGKRVINLLVILPIALPGIVTGVALQSVIQNLLQPVFGISAGLFTIIVGHATFCIVVVYNNALARLRRVAGSFEEASADLGADSWQTFRHVTFPALRTPLLAGALLAFALSFDEVVVTIFTSGAQQTLPIWIFANLSRPRELPIVNVVALVLILASTIPVYLAQRLSREPTAAAAPAAAAAGAKQ
jgi:putative spermidine/putrescine transport system permease protein